MSKVMLAAMSDGGCRRAWRSNVRAECQEVLELRDPALATVQLETSERHAIVRLVGDQPAAPMRQTRPEQAAVFIDDEEECELPVSGHPFAHLFLFGGVAALLDGCARRNRCVDLVGVRVGVVVW